MDIATLLQAIKEYGLPTTIIVALIPLGYKLAVKALTTLDKYHRDAVGAIRDVGDKIDTLTLTTAKHGIELEYGNKEFTKIEVHQAQQDEKIESNHKECREKFHEVKNKLHSLQNKMMTKDHIELLLEAKVK